MALVEFLMETLDGLKEQILYILMYVENPRLRII